MGKKVLLKGNSMHPSVERAVNIIKESFEQLCLKDQDILGSKEQWNKVLALISDEDLKSDLETRMAKLKNSVERWVALRDVCKYYVQSKTWKQRKTGEFLSNLASSWKGKLIEQSD